MKIKSQKITVLIFAFALISLLLFWMIKEKDVEVVYEILHSFCQKLEKEKDADFYLSIPIRKGTVLLCSVPYASFDDLPFPRMTKKQLHGFAYGREQCFLAVVSRYRVTAKYISWPFIQPANSLYIGKEHNGSLLLKIQKRGNVFYLLNPSSDEKESSDAYTHRESK